MADSLLLASHARLQLTVIEFRAALDDVVFTGFIYLFICP